MTEELKPCPSCETVAGIGRLDDKRWYIECASPSCNLTFQPIARWDREQIIQRWNTRIESTRHD